MRPDTVGQSGNRPAADQNMLSGCGQAGTALRWHVWSLAEPK